MIPGITDPVYFRFLAAHAGLWYEVGVLDDAALLRRLRRERRVLGLPFDRWVRPLRTVCGKRPVRGKRACQ